MHVMHVSVWLLDDIKLLYGGGQKAWGPSYDAFLSYILFCFIAFFY